MYAIFGKGDTVLLISINYHLVADTEQFGKTKGDNI